jgi:hypothetical protein
MVGQMSQLWNTLWPSLDRLSERLEQLQELQEFVDS